MSADLLLVLRWWLTLLLVSLAAWPWAHKIFTNWYDRGYLLAKALGLAGVTFGVFLLASLHIVPFTQLTVCAVALLLFLAGVLVNRHPYPNWKLVVIEELLFFTALLGWSWVKAHEPSIRGLEKFMDYGFTKSILESDYFPALDMWYAGSKNYINYYYFGHTSMAVLTKFSGINLDYSFNLMLATLFVYTLTLSLTLAYQLSKNWPAAILTAYIIALGGNLQTIYAWTKGYPGEASPPPFWQIWTGKLDPGYWYANATRFIPFSIHEFPSYSFVVSDIHGHVLSLPFVLLTLGLLVTIFVHQRHSWPIYALYGWIVGINLMTNALDGPIYGALFAILITLTPVTWLGKFKSLLTVVSCAVLASLPFLVNFSSFVNGLAVNCPPALLANYKIGPLIFESIDKCQRSSPWMLLILWGFFLYCGAWFLAKLKPSQNLFITVLLLFSVGLIIFPEFFYFKDIYPQHFRSNTMFKLGYQAFIMFGLVAGFTISKMRSKGFFLGLLPLLLLVIIYPFFSVRSYFGNLQNYLGLDGLAWLRQQYPNNYTAIKWLDDYAQPGEVIVEADGDSYTDYNQFSAFTGQPAVVGWAVHEWLWRGSYDVVAPRREEVRLIYESPDSNLTRGLLAKYRIRYIIVGNLEREKFKSLQESKLLQLADPVFTTGTTIVLRIRG